MGSPGYGDPLATLSERVDYMQGRWLRSVQLDGGAQWTRAAAGSRRLVQVTGIGTLDKSEQVRADQARKDASPGKDASPRWLPPSADLMVGLHGRTSLIYQVVHLGGGLQLRAGVWSARADAADLDLRERMLTGILRGCYPDVGLLPTADRIGTSEYGGYVVGVPNPRPPRGEDPATPWDRLLRVLRQENWAVVLLAQPMTDDGRTSFRDGLLTESRVIRQAMGADAPGGSRADSSPLASLYLDLAKAGLTAMTEAQAVGAWRTAVYLLGDAPGYRHLAAAWKGLFTGVESGPLPVTVLTSGPAAGFARDWAMPDIDGPRGPGSFRYPFAAQTVLTSHQLAAYFHLPQQEHPGYAVEQIPVFDTRPTAGDQAPVFDPDPRPTRQGAVYLGGVIDRGQQTGDPYFVTTDSLTKHAFVAGVTGAGKTNTILGLLTAASEGGKPFLVIEPAKTEYRSLLTAPALGSRLRVFTAGDETLAPFRLNPLEVPREGATGTRPKTPVAAHLDLFRALFSAAFALWSPLPQVLERALYLAYADFGWDLNSNSNPRLDSAGEWSSAFPTVSDLYTRVEEVITQTGYDPEATARMRGKLSANLGGLRVGGKGRMLDAGYSTPDHVLFDEPAVIELESLGDEDDKAFMMGLLLIRLAEYRRAQDPSEELRHLIVLEEAHRLLANRGRGSDKDFGDASGKSIETFTNLLAEVRAYGQGLIIADQVPSRLAPEVLKNTNLKVVHRLVAEDDRHAIGATMGMTERQTRSLTALAPGRAAVFTEGEDAPLLIAFPPAKSRLNRPTDDQVRASRPDTGLTPRTCCGQASEAVCDRARDASNDAALRRLVSQFATTAATNPSAVTHLWEDLEIQFNTLLPSALKTDAGPAGWRCLAWRAATYLGQRRAAQRGWTYRQMHDYTEALSELMARLGESDLPGAADAAGRFRKLSGQLFRRDIDPFPHCATICPDRTCLFRWPVADVLSDPALANTFREILAEAWASAKPQLKAHADEVSYQVTALPRVTWSQPEIDAGVQATEAAAACAAQFAIAAYNRPGTSNSLTISSFFQPEAQPEA
jgi:hypothetical protein